MNSPQLVCQDFGGRLSADLNATASRILKNGSWKKQRIVVVIPAAAKIPAKCALAMWNLIWPPNQGVVRILAQNAEVGAAYSSAIEAVLAHPQLASWEWLLTLEEDNAPPPDAVLKLIARMEAHPEFSVIGALYFCKGYENPVSQLWGTPEGGFMPQVPRPGELIEVGGTGMGCTLFRLQMFKDSKLRRPWFETMKSDSGCATQDLHFASDARKHGYRFAVDCGIACGHYDAENDIMY